MGQLIPLINENIDNKYRYIYLLPIFYYYIIYLSIYIYGERESANTYTSATFWVLCLLAARYAKMTLLLNHFKRVVYKGHRHKQLIRIQSHKCWYKGPGSCRSIVGGVHISFAFSFKE